jgi:ABC-2 type transport system permease protein
VLRSVFTKTLWDQRRSLLVWAGGIAAVAAMYSSFYPSVRQRSAETVASLPPALRQALGFGQIASPAGYLEATVFNFIVPVLLIVFAAAAGARAVAGDEEAGTLDLLLAHPVDRVGIVLHRFAALAVGCLAVGAAVLLGLLAVAGPAELDVPAADFAAMALHLALLGLCFGAVALAIGAATGRRAAALAGTATAAVLAYFANTLAPQHHATAWLQKASPFAYYAGGQPLEHGVQLADVAVLLTVSIALVAAGAVVFSRRDVSV